MIHIFINKTRVLLQVTAVLLIIVASYAAVSCSGADPVIYKLDTQLQVYSPQPNSFQERLLVQILADDDDGFDEIYEVYIIHDDSELYWRVTKDEWDIVKEEGNEWIVLNNVVALKSQNLPRGEYRIVLLDFSGYRDEHSIFLKQPNRTHTQNDFPQLQYRSQGVYLPKINEAKLQISANPLILELTHPQLSEQEQIRQVAYFGKTGEFYEIENNKPIQFVLNKNALARVFIHHESKDGFLYSSGPYNLQFRAIN